MAESTGIALSQMNLETGLAQDALRDELPQGYPDTQANHLHEERDANLRIITLTTAGMGALGIGMFVGLWLLLGLFTRIPATPDAPISPLALNLPPPPAPRIEDATPQNYQIFLSSEEHWLHSSGPLPAENHSPNTMADSTGAVTPLSNPGPGVVGPGGEQFPVGTTHISLEQAEVGLLQRGFDTRPQTGTTPFPQQAPAGGLGKPESLPLGMQPTGTYRADVGPQGKNP